MKARLALVFFLAAGVSASAQWLNRPDPKTPRLPNGKPNLSAPAPRTRDGKIDLGGLWNNPDGRFLTDLAKRFNGSDRASLDGQCINVHVVSKSSGEAASLLADDWPNPKANGPRPVVWSPAPGINVSSEASWRSMSSKLGHSGTPAA